MHILTCVLQALAASAAAHAFRGRWDTPSFSTEFEKPFQWTDPAAVRDIQSSLIRSL